ncbi:MAG: nucleotidyltransferase family protein [Burkholderiaceae bacterium]|mgnify:CR=1 FL=1|nr:nucleotidyltransferase family protein [Burkholderiaceae bacterium]
MADIIGLILAAGRGKRFDPTGARNKLLAPLPDGRAVLRASCENLMPWVDRLVVITGTHGADLRAALADLAIDWVESDRVDLGMGASLKAGVGATHPATGWLFALGDMPFIAPATLRLARDALRSGAPLTRPECGGQPGHPVACAASLRGALLNLPDEAGVGALARRDPALMSSFAVVDAGSVRDIDVPGDLG